MIDLVSATVKEHLEKLTVPLTLRAFINTHSSSSSDHSGLNCSLQIGHGIVALVGSLGAGTHLRLRAARRSLLSLAVEIVVSGFGDDGPASAFSWINACMG